MRIEWLAWYADLLLDSSVRVLALAALVGLLQAVLRVRASAMRHAAWTAVLAAMLLMPALRTISPTVDVAVPLPEPLAAPAREWLAPAEPPLPRFAGDLDTFVTAALPDAAGRRTATQPIDRLPAWPAALGALYLTGVFLFSVRMCVGWRATRRLSSLSVKLESHGPLVYESAHVTVPVTVGIFSPRIVLPSSWIDWPSDKLAAVLAHERAHLQRRDPLIGFIAQINRGIFWFHPLAWWLERELKTRAEHACDDAAVLATGKVRRYAEVLLDMAESMRRGGGRVSWPAIGVGGTGLLGQRIDRLLRGDLVRETSRLRIAALAAGCALAIATAIACRQQIPAAPLQPDLELTAQRTRMSEEQRSSQSAAEAARKMSREEVAAVETAFTKNPDDLDAARKLLLFYRWSKEGHPFGWNDMIARRRPIAIATIARHPEHTLASGSAYLLSAKRDPEGHAAAAKVWREHAQKPDASAKVLSNAARFFEGVDVPFTETLLTRARALDPEAKALALLPTTDGGKSYWGARIGYIYASALTGRRHPGGSEQVAGTIEEPYAASVRQKLAATTDVRMLNTVGSELLRLRDAHPNRRSLTELGVTCLERAIQLDPAFVQPRVVLHGFHRHERDRQVWDRLLSAQKTILGADKIDALAGNDPARQKLLRQVEPQAAATLDDADRLTLLPYLASNAFGRSERAEYYKKQGVNAEESLVQAGKYAEEALTLAERFKNHPAYSATVHSARMTLASVAYKNGNRDKAIEHLLESTRVPPSDDLAYKMVVGGPTLLKPLLDAGERDAVIEYLERMAKLNVYERDRLLKSAEAIRAGRMPNWYQYQITAQ